MSSSNSYFLKSRWSFPNIFSNSATQPRQRQQPQQPQQPCSTNSSTHTKSHDIIPKPESASAYLFEKHPEWRKEHSELLEKPVTILLCPTWAKTADGGERLTVDSCHFVNSSDIHEHHAELVYETARKRAEQELSGVEGIKPGSDLKDESMLPAIAVCSNLASAQGPWSSETLDYISKDFFIGFATEGEIAEIKCLQSRRLIDEAIAAYEAG